MQLSEIQTLQIEPTSHCNAKCPHCPRFNFIDHGVFESDGTLHPDLTLSNIDVEQFIKNIDLNKMTSLSRVLIEGDKGDPLMHPKIEKFIEFFSSLAFPPIIQLTTNGSIRNSRWWANLAKKQYPTLNVVFSIDGLADTNHLYRVGLDYKKIMNNAQAFINNGGYAIWKLIVFKHNEHQIDNIRSLSRQMGFSAFGIVNSSIDRFKGLSRWAVKHENGSEHYIEPAEKLHVTHREIFKTFPKHQYPTSNIDSRICPNLAKGQIYITHQSYVLPCCMMHFVPEQQYFGRDQYLKLAENLDDQCLSTNTLEIILNNSFFKHNLIDSLKSGNWHHVCATSCKKKIINNIAQYDNLKQHN